MIKFNYITSTIYKKAKQICRLKNLTKPYIQTGCLYRLQAADCQLHCCLLTEDASEELATHPSPPFSNFREPLSIPERLIEKTREYRQCMMIVCDEAYTSKTCSECGQMHCELGLSKVFLSALAAAKYQIATLTRPEIFFCVNLLGIMPQ